MFVRLISYRIEALKAGLTRPHDAVKGQVDFACVRSARLKLASVLCARSTDPIPGVNLEITGNAETQKKRPVTTENDHNG